MFSIKNKLFNLLLRIYRPVFEELRCKVAYDTQRSIATALLHQKTFAEFRNKYVGKEVVLVGAGPTLNQFVPVQGAIYVGLNRAFLYNKVHFDYLFTIDKAGLDLPDEALYEKFFSYNAVKFVGDQNLGPNYQIPCSKFANVPDVRLYKTTAGWLPDRFLYDIDSQPLANSSSCSIQAMQFILFTNPRKIYLVGIDCTCGMKGHFTGTDFDAASRAEDAVGNNTYVIDSWKNLKEFARTYYPETEIISVNPIGLKGIFTDVYTESYLKEHPEIDPKTVQILGK